MMKSVSFRSLLSITFCVLLLFLLPASLAFAEGNSEKHHILCPAAFSAAGEPCLCRGEQRKHNIYVSDR